MTNIVLPWVGFVFTAKGLKFKLFTTRDKARAYVKEAKRNGSAYRSVVTRYNGREAKRLFTLRNTHNVDIPVASKPVLRLVHTEEKKVTRKVKPRRRSVIDDLPLLEALVREVFG